MRVAGYVVLLTNYTGSTGFGEAFSRGIQGDPLQGPADEINQAADEAIRRYPVHRRLDGRWRAARATAATSPTGWRSRRTGIARSRATPACTT